jgi:DNA-binding protein HU-beta
LLALAFRRASGETGIPRRSRRAAIAATGRDGQEEKDMNKGDLVSAVADETKMSKAQAGDAVEAVINVITKALKKGEEVKIVGFGTFAVAKRAAGTARNPRTGETIKVPASLAPKFKAGQGLKDAVNKR